MVEYMYWGDPHVVKRVESILKNNVALCATDTVLGLIATATKQGVDRLNYIKGRIDKPYLLLIESVYKAHFYVNQHQLLQIENLITACWPGPLTLIFSAQNGIPHYLCGRDGTIALRVPQHEGLLTLLSNFQGLLSTSANKTENPPACCIQHVSEDIKQIVGCIVLDHEHTCKPALPSTILDVTENIPRVVRAGAYPIKELEKIHGIPFL